MASDILGVGGKMWKVACKVMKKWELPVSRKVAKAQRRLEGSVAVVIHGSPLVYARGSATQSGLARKCGVETPRRLKDASHAKTLRAQSRTRGSGADEGVRPTVIGDRFGLGAFALIRIAFLLLVSFCTQAVAQNQATAPIDGAGRFKWFVRSSVGPAGLAGGAISSGWGSMLNVPHEYGSHWDGFGKRYGMRLTGVVTGNAMEASLGAVWGEDPRYPRATGQPFGGRVRQIVKMTFLARSAGGGNMPAYARYAAIAGNNFLSNTWRVSSEADTQHALARIGLGFAGRMASNAFVEFWPSVRGRLTHRRFTQRR